MKCDYCSSDAVGVDEDGNPTCGAYGCMPVEAPLPRVEEASGDEDEEGEEDIS